MTIAAEEKEGILYNLTPKYKEKYLDTVEKHVTMLGAKAKEYKKLVIFIDVNNNLDAHCPMQRLYVVHGKLKSILQNKEHIQYRF